MYVIISISNQAKQATQTKGYIMETLDKIAIEALVRNSVNNSEELPDNWEMNEEDVKLVGVIFSEKAPKTDAEKEELLSDFVRIDSKTHRLMIAGMMIFGGAAYFVDVEDAVEYLNANGVECKDFCEAYELSERGEIEDTFYTEWYEPSYS